MPAQEKVPRRPARFKSLPKPGTPVLPWKGQLSEDTRSIFIVAGEPVFNGHYWELPTFWAKSGRVNISLAVGHWWVRGKGFAWNVVGE